MSLDDPATITGANAGVLVNRDQHGVSR